MKRKIPMLQPRVKEMEPRLKELPPIRVRKTLKDRQQETGRTLALNGAAWRRLRARVLSLRPLCEKCYREGLIVEATDVDHRDNDPTDNRPEALQSLCHSCHSRKTQADMGKRVSWGCDSNGMPLDPEHPWNKP